MTEISDVVNHDTKTIHTFERLTRVLTLAPFCHRLNKYSFFLSSTHLSFVRKLYLSDIIITQHHACYTITTLYGYPRRSAPSIFWSCVFSYCIWLSLAGIGGRCSWRFFSLAFTLISWHAASILSYRANFFQLPSVSLVELRQQSHIDEPL